MKKDNSFLFLIGFAITTIILWQIPDGKLILYPFTILGTWFHEMGHGLTAMFLGGDFHYLKIFSDGSGLAVFSGSLFLGSIGKAIVAAGGPIGPTIAGAFFIAISRNDKAVRIALFFLAAILIISVILWIRSFFGIVIISSFAIVIIAIVLKATYKMKTLTIQFLGVQAFASVYLSFDYLFSSGGNVDGNQYLSDTAVISDNLFLPYWFWGGIIIIFSLFLFVKSLRFAYKNNK